MPHTAEELLERLDSAIDERDTYIMRRTSEIDSMVMNLSSSPFERTAGYIDIAKKYKSLCADSAIIYLRRASADAYSLSDSVLIFRSRMALAAILPLVDLEREAILIFESVDAESCQVNGSVNITMVPPICIPLFQIGQWHCLCLVRNMEPKLIPIDSMPCGIIRRNHPNGFFMKRVVFTSTEIARRR